MTAQRPSFPRLDLAANYLRELQIAIFVERTPAIEAIANEVHPDDRGRHFSMASYVKQGKAYRFQEFVIFGVDNDNDGDVGNSRLVFLFVYQPIPQRRKYIKDFPHPGALLAALARKQVEGEFGCTVRFSYSATGFESVYPLPTQPTLAEMPFDEIRGIRGAKLADDNSGSEVFSFILEILDDRILLSLEFALVGPVTADVPSNTLTLATSIANTLVRAQQIP